MLWLLRCSWSSSLACSASPGTRTSSELLLLLLHKAWPWTRTETRRPRLGRRTFATASHRTASQPHLKMTPLDLDHSATGEIFRRVTAVPELVRVRQEFESGGYEIRIAGGAVRDILSGITPNDVDLATTATPDQMTRLLEKKENIRLIINRSGVRHGTITVRVNDTNQYEVTTLRIDRITDGRHAQVEFTTDWKIDASRRDLTINSMFLDFSGVVHDYFTGLEDLSAKRIRFVGEARDRITEDYLRIYRYFRFFARYAEGSHDPDTMAAMVECAHGLEGISGERKWQELRRILTSLRCDSVMPAMFSSDLNLGRFMGMEVERREEALREFARVHQNVARLEAAAAPDLSPHDPATLLAALIGSDEELLNVIRVLRLSNAERDLVRYVIANRADVSSINEQDLKVSLALAVKPQQEHTRRYAIELLRYSGHAPELMRTLSAWEIPQFPVRGHIIGERVKTRRLIGKVMEDLKRVWAANNFSLPDDRMRSALDDLLRTKYIDENSGDLPKK